VQDTEAQLLADHTLLISQRQAFVKEMKVNAIAIQREIVQKKKREQKWRDESDAERRRQRQEKERQREHNSNNSRDVNNTNSNNINQKPSTLVSIPHTHGHTHTRHTQEKTPLSPMAVQNSLSLPLDVSEWTVNDVCVWLNEISLSQYTKQFQEASMDGVYCVCVRVCVCAVRLYVARTQF